MCPCRGRGGAIVRPMNGFDNSGGAKPMAFSTSEFQAFCTRISRIRRIFFVFHGEPVLSARSVYRNWFLSTDNEKTIYKTSLRTGFRVRAEFAQSGHAGGGLKKSVLVAMEEKVPRWGWAFIRARANAGHYPYFGFRTDTISGNRSNCSLSNVTNSVPKRKATAA